MSVHLPHPKQVRDLFAQLLTREVQLEPGAAVTPGERTPSSVALYVDDDDRRRAVLACDLDLSVRAAAALGLVPQRHAEVSIRGGSLTEALAENLHEVMDVAARLFNDEGGTPVRLDAVHAAGWSLPDDVRAAALTLGRREDLALDIGGYGPGRLSAVLL
jgi:hypothetical protein